MANPFDSSLHSTGYVGLLTVELMACTGWYGTRPAYGAFGERRAAVEVLNIRTS